MNTSHQNKMPWNESGHTVVEISIYMILISLFIMLITQTFVTILNTRLETRSYSHVGQDGRYILTRLAYDMRRASLVTTPASQGDSGNTLVLTIDGSPATYSLTSGILSVDYGSGDQALNGSGTVISDLSFTRLGSGIQATIQTTFTVTSTTQESQEAETRDFQTTTAIREY